jgi:hypothetical protein
MTGLPRLDPDDLGNNHLHALLGHLHPEDLRPFIEKFTTQPIRARFHTYRELLVGVHLRDRGFDVRYEQKIGNQTPDWCLVDDAHKAVEIIDVLTLHQRHDKDVEIRESIKQFGRWTGWITVPPEHIYRKLSDKAGQYSKLAIEGKTPYVLAIYGEFTASIDPQEMTHVLLAQYGGWFRSNPHVSGAIYCRSKDMDFEYTYFVNPRATNGSALLSE